MAWAQEVEPAKGSMVLYWIAYNGTDAQLTNIPASFTEILAGNTNKRIQADLTGRSRCRMMVCTGATAGPNGSTMECQYSLDSGSSWSSSFITATLVGTNASHSATAWVSLPVAARTDVLLRMGTNGGDGTTDPTLNILFLEIQ